MRRLLVLLLLCSTTVYAEWVKDPISAKNNWSIPMYAIQKESVKDTGSSYVRGWILYNDVESKTSDMLLVLSNCNTGEFRVLQFTSYSLLNGQGSVKNSQYNIPYDEWPMSFPTPNSIWEPSTNQLCRLAGK